MDVDKELDILFGKLFAFNSRLLKASNKECDEYSPIDIIDFYLSSHALEIVKHLYYGNDFLLSVGFFANARNYLEGLAFKRCILSKEFTSLNTILLQKQFYLEEYKTYKNVINYPALVIKEKLEIDYKNAVKFFKLTLDGKYTNKEIKAIINSTYPCLCNPKITTRCLVNTYLDEEEVKLYNTFSWYVHPGTNNFYRQENWEENFKYIINVLIKEYIKLPNGEYTLTSWDNIASSDIGLGIELEIDNQASELFKIADTFYRHYGDNYISDTLITISNLLKDLANDERLSLTEQIKIKFKSILELFAVIYAKGLDFLLNNKQYQLLLKHEEIKHLLNNGVNCNDKIKEAYLIYKDIYPQGINEDIFKSTFIKTIGYMIDENNTDITINKVVNSFLNKLNPNSISLIKILYQESQLLSHANGYMWFSNKGAFSDTKPIFYTIDDSISIILNRLKSYYENLNDNKFKDITNVLRNSLKRLGNIKIRRDQFWNVKKIDIIE